MEPILTKNTRESEYTFRRLTRNRFLMFLIAWGCAIFIWMLISALTQLPAFILPKPADVWHKLIDVLKNGVLWRNFSYTFLEVVLGLLLGSLLATLLAYWLSHKPVAERLLSPFLVGSQSVPIVAVAPLLVIWLGPGLGTKIFICGLTVFFPILISTLVGFREVSRDLHELMRALRASPHQTLRYLEWPAALPVILGGLRVGATLSVIGAIVGELVGSDQGLGFLINVGRGQYDTALVFVAVFTLILLATSLYGLILLLESKVLAWQTWRKEA
ncbi:MAG: ABC transporter permease [Anaerolineaceae bacterium]|nr:ABC transporter permease [Anaerolineaceae bacterium]